MYKNLSLSPNLCYFLVTHSATTTKGIVSQRKRSNPLLIHGKHIIALRPKFRYLQEFTYCLAYRQPPSNKYDSSKYQRQA